MNSKVHLSTLTCPDPTCQHQQRVMMPTTVCQLSYTCDACSMTHVHKSEDCCVFCSYADTPCPSMQKEETCGAPGLSDQETPAMQG
jgi:hypothetical protein